MRLSGAAQEPMLIYLGTSRLTFGIPIYSVKGGGAHAAETVPDQIGIAGVVAKALFEHVPAAFVSRALDVALQLAQPAFVILVHGLRTPPAWRGFISRLPIQS
jgi:hypothetical protein